MSKRKGTSVSRRGRDCTRVISCDDRSPRGVFVVGCPKCAELEGGESNELLSGASIKSACARAGKRPAAAIPKQVKRTCASPSRLNLTQLPVLLDVHFIIIVWSYQPLPVDLVDCIKWDNVFYVQDIAQAQGKSHRIPVAALRALLCLLAQMVVYPSMSTMFRSKQPSKISTAAVYSGLGLQRTAHNKFLWHCKPNTAPTTVCCGKPCQEPSSSASW